MNSALSPREIQSRLRAGASVSEVAAEAGVEVARIEGFALPVLAERAHMTRTALNASVRRRGDGSGHRRLGEIVRERLQARGLDADTVEWDAWRQNNLAWRVVGLLDDHAASRAAEFVFDPKGRFSVADNADARWMVGESLPGSTTDPDNENTIDFNDELALVRAISDEPSGAATGRPGDDVPPHESHYQGAGHTSELDELYDMLSGVSEDSVRIYLGLDDSEASEPETDVAGEDTQSMDRDELAAILQGADVATGQEAGAPQAAAPAQEPSEQPDEDEPARETEVAVVGISDSEDSSSEPDEGNEEHSAGAGDPAAAAAETPEDQTPAEEQHPDGRATSHGTPSEPSDASAQDPLVPDAAPAPPRRRPAKKRASIPSWDEIMFGGPPRG